MPLHQFKPFDRDKLMMYPRDQAAYDAHQALVPINRLEGEQMVAAVAILFAAITRRVGLSPEEAYHLGRKMLEDQDFHHKANNQLQALQDFAGIQVKGDQNVSYA